MSQSSQDSASSVADISVITFTLGTRDKYLFNCLDSVYYDGFNDGFSGTLEHHVIFQGSVPDKSTKECLGIYKKTPSYELIIHEWPQNIGIAAGINKILPECKSNLIFKMDDDCKIITADFFDQAMIIHKEFPKAIFSPFPTGLTNNLGGPPAISRSIFYDKGIDRYYVLRNVNHVGGFARFWPKNSFVFQPDLFAGISGTEDGQLSQWAGANGIPMFYLETGMAVEHNEGLAQQIRYPDYFANRTGDKETLKRWVVK